MTTHVQSPAIPAAELICSGTTDALNDDKVSVDLEIGISGSTNCSLKGSLNAPLGHYVVLGTANSLVTDPAATAVAPAGRGSDDDEGGRRGGRGSYDGGARGGYEGGFSPPSDVFGGLTVGGMPGMGMQPSRLAFIVQVIENKTYGTEQ